MFLIADKISLTKEEKIAALEAELKKNSAATMTTSANNIGMKKAAALEMFQPQVYNIKKNPDLMPCPRRPPGKK